MVLLDALPHLRRHLTPLPERHVLDLSEVTHLTHFLTLQRVYVLLSVELHQHLFLESLYETLHLARLVRDDLPERLQEVEVQVLSVDSQFLVILGRLEDLLSHLVIQQELQNVLVKQVALRVERHHQRVQLREVPDLEHQRITLVQLDVLFLGRWLVHLHLDLSPTERVLPRCSRFALH